jgi:hypothetical protein
MGGWRISFEMQWNYKGRTGGQPLFDTMVTDLNNVLGDFGPVFREIASEIFEPHTLARFASEGADIGGWQELAESTIKARQRKMGGMLKTDVRHRGGMHSVAMGGLISALGFGLPILVESGALMGSFQAEGADHVERIGKKQMEWGSADPVAVFHQTGTKKGFGKSRVETGKGSGRGMAQRKIITITKEEESEMKSVLIGRLRQEMRRAGYAIAGRTMGRAEASTLGPVEAAQIGEAAMEGAPGADLLDGM